MDLQIRTISERELVPFILAASTASGDAPDDAEIERERRMAEPERTMAAFDGPDIVGTSSVFTMPMSCPGGEIDVGFLTSVGSYPRIGAEGSTPSSYAGSSTTHTTGASSSRSCTHPKEGSTAGTATGSARSVW